MPDDNSSAPAPVSPTPTLPTVKGVDDASTIDASAVPDVPGATNVTDTPEVPNAPMPEVSNVPNAPSIPVSDAVVMPDVLPNPATAAAPTTSGEIGPSNTEIPAEVARKIGEAHNVLVALSGDPSVDEMAAAIGLSLYLDRLGKRATAIYSGQTPNALEFLKPEEMFENSVDTLQDFVIALNKDKADHLRYKLDGDYVKIYITPYQSKISEEDLEFSYGDYNVDLVLALDVANGADLDAALREHGRIMHDAVIINITTGNPGRLGEIEWSDKSASSVSEMIARLLLSVNGKTKIEKEEATAFLTGIVAATNRFSSAGTTPETMQIASKLMESGANQQLVSKNITPDVENELFRMPEIKESVEPEVDNDPTKLKIQHGENAGADESKVVSGTVTEKESTLLDDLKAAEASLAAAGAETTPEVRDEPLRIDSAVETGLPEVENQVKEEVNSDANLMGTETASSANNTINDNVTKDDMSGGTNDVETSDATGKDDATDLTSDAMNGVLKSDMTGMTNSAVGNTPKGDVVDAVNSATNDAPKNDVAGVTNSAISGESKSDIADAMNSVTNDGENNVIMDNPEKVVEPSATMNDMRLPGANEAEKYGQMLENALADAGDLGMGDDNPATMSAPSVVTNPEINGVPEINYMPMPGEEVLPPPPTPPIDMNAPVPAEAITAPITPIEPAVPVVDNPAGPLGTQPAMQDQVYNSQANDPGAFKIPGM